MTVTMNDLELIENLDFDTQCEHSNHVNSIFHDDGPAAAFTKITCPHCGRHVAIFVCRKWATILVTSKGFKVECNLGGCQNGFIAKTEGNLEIIWI